MTSDDMFVSDFQFFFLYFILIISDIEIFPYTEYFLFKTTFDLISLITFYIKMVFAYFAKSEDTQETLHSDKTF